MAKIIAEEITDEKVRIMAEGAAPDVMSLLRITEDKILGGLAEKLLITPEQMKYVFNAGGKTEGMSDSEVKAFCMETLHEMELMGKEKNNG